MPTFNTRGITATLSIAPLQGTLSDSINIADPSQQEKRVKKAFDAGQKLRERPLGPIGPNGKSPGVLQFLGADGDIPFLMAEASERLSEPIPRQQSMSEDADSARGTPLDDTPDSQMLAELSASSELATHPAPTGINIGQESQALMLTVATSTSSHIKNLAVQRTIVKIPDLKIEVLFNGTLIGSEYINPRRANAAISTNKTTYFAGVRIHRSMEKPWVYQAADSLVTGSQTAQEKWNAIGAALKEEAYDRGIDKDGNPSPSAAFLSALAAVPLPEHLKDTSRLGVIDIIVSTGNGGKHGSSSGFVLGPLRMESGKFKKVAHPITKEAPTPDRSLSASPIVSITGVDEPPKKKARRDSQQTLDTPVSSPHRKNRKRDEKDRADLAIELGAAPAGRLVKQIAPSLPTTPPTHRRRKDLTKDGKIQSPIKLKLSATRGTAKSWIIDPLLTSSDDSAVGLSEVSQAPTKTSRSAKGDPYTDEEALENFEPPQLCEGGAMSFAGAGKYRIVPRWRPGWFDEDEVVAGLRIVVT